LQFFFPAGGSRQLWWQLVGVGSTVAAAGLVFFVVAYLLRVAELQDVATVVRRKLKR
jgi:hypothetical protein